MKYLGSFIMLLMLAANLYSGDRLLTLDDIYGPETAAGFSDDGIPSLEWGRTGDYLVRSGDYDHGIFARIDLSTGKETEMVNREALLESLQAIPGFSGDQAVEMLRQAGYTLSPLEDRMLVQGSDDLFLFTFSTGRMARLTEDSARETGAAFSPSGSQVAFIREGDLYVLDLASGGEQRLTASADGNILNGCLDWVYQEEVYGRGDFKGFWWSPDSSRIVFLQLDISQEPVCTIVDNRKIHAGEERQRYPHPGDPNAGVRLGLIDLRDGGIRWMSLDRFDGMEILVVRVDWAEKSGRLTAQVQDREQTWLELLEFDPGSGAETLLIREESPAWVNRLESPFWLADGSFIWQSERTGYRHLYHYSARGELLRPLTSGEWEVRGLGAVAEELGTVFFSAAREDFRELQVYRTDLRGSRPQMMGNLPGQHRARFNEQGSMYVDTWSDIDTLPEISLRDAEGGQIRTLFESLTGDLQRFRLSRPEFIQVRARDGFPLEGMIIKPPDFDETKKYPVMMYTYGGPGSQSVLNRWGGKTYLWHQYLASRGYVIWVFDSRIASGKGAVSAWSGYRDLGPIGLRDIEDGLEALARNPWIDRDRIGIWGWSYGGYSVAYALTHSSWFKIGIAGAPVTDWRYYDSIYTERYMGLPEGNPGGYDSSSVISEASQLSGRLLLIHGAIDDNVHVVNSMSLMENLQKAGIQFDFMIYPGSRHGVRDPLQVRQMREMMTLFIIDNL